MNNGILLDKTHNDILGRILLGRKKFKKLRKFIVFQKFRQMTATPS